MSIIGSIKLTLDSVTFQNTRKIKGFRTTDKQGLY